MSHLNISDPVNNFLIENMEATMDSYKEKVIEKIVRQLSLEDFEYNEDCIQINEDRSILVISSLFNDKEILIKFSHDKLFIVMNDLSMIGHFKDFVVSKRDSVENKADVLYISQKNEKTSYEFFSMSDTYLEQERRYFVIQLIYCFINYNVFKRMDLKKEISEEVGY